MNALLASIALSALAPQFSDGTLPKVGSPAPDFTAYSRDSDAVFKLSTRRREKPLVLIFGSCT